jgi:hypothetical protein
MQIELSLKDTSFQPLPLQHYHLNTDIFNKKTINYFEFYLPGNWKNSVRCTLVLSYRRLDKLMSCTLLLRYYVTF